MRSAEEKAESRRAVLEQLGRMGISYEMIEHEAAYTVEDMDRIGFGEHVTVCKNLFVRDQKKKHLPLARVVAQVQRRATWKPGPRTARTSISFASADRLKRYLGLAQGEVTPLGVLNDANHEVTVVFDQDLKGKDHLGVHPNDNTATLILSYDNILRFVTGQGNPVRHITVRG